MLLILPFIFAKWSFEGYDFIYKKKYYSFIKIYGELGADTATLHCCFVIDGGHYITEDTYQSIISDFC